MNSPIKLRRRYPVTGVIEYATAHANAQLLIGYDMDGKEIYEGDVVISEFGDEVIARLMDNLPPKCKLKEDSDEKTN